MKVIFQLRVKQLVMLVLLEKVAILRIIKEGLIVVQDSTHPQHQVNVFFVPLDITVNQLLLLLQLNVQLVVIHLQVQPNVSIVRRAFSVQAQKCSSWKGVLLVLTVWGMLLTAQLVQRIMSVLTETV